MRRWQTVVSCLLILLLRLPYAAAQALHQCKMPDGSLVLTNEPCPGEDRKTAPPPTAPAPQPLSEEKAPRRGVTQRNASESTLAEALRALRKIQAATDVGINFSEYGELVVEAKAAVNEAIAEMGDSTLSKELQAAMQAYADASTAWNLSMKDSASFRGYSFFVYEGSEGRHLDTKYRFTKSTSGVADKQNALNTIWAVAKAHLDRATQLAKSQ